MQLRKIVFTGILASLFVFLVAAAIVYFTTRRSYDTPATKSDKRTTTDTDSNYYKNDIPRTPSVKFAVDWYDIAEACKRDSFDACKQRLRAYNESLPIDIRYSKENLRLNADMLETLCHARHPQACGMAGSIYDDGPIRDDERAANFYSIGCSSGDYVACANLGWEYYSADGVDLDTELALYHTTFACNMGVDFACRNLGVFYENGIGIPVSSDMAVDLYEYACFTGDFIACSNLGVLSANVYEGRGDVFFFFEMACGAGYGRGCGNLAEMYSSGYGLPVDFEIAFDLFRQGCARGDWWSCLKFATLLDEKIDQHAEEIYDRAESLAHRACLDGDYHACEANI